VVEYVMMCTNVIDFFPSLKRKIRRYEFTKPIVDEAQKEEKLEFLTLVRDVIQAEEYC
jgi:hypothetical protein